MPVRRLAKCGERGAVRAEHFDGDERIVRQRANERRRQERRERGDVPENGHERARREHRAVASGQPARVVETKPVAEETLIRSVAERPSPMRKLERPRARERRIEARLDRRVRERRSDCG